VADVQVGLGTVFRDEHLAVLERRHRARIDVQVRIEFLRLYGEAARFQQPSERGGDDSLAEAGHDAPRDEDVLRRPSRHLDLPSECVELAQDRRPFDQRTEGTTLSEDGEACKGADRDPPASFRETTHGIQA
jgi:hypothetical protein